MLTIYGRTTSFNVQKVMWLVGELGLPHVRRDVGGKFGGTTTPEFLAMNPNGKIPVINDDGVIVWESNAIVRYFTARYATGSWCPADPGRRAQADQWMDWIATTLNVGFMGLFVGYIRTAPERRNWAAIRADQERCAQDYGLLDRHLAQRAYMLGETITMADIPVGASLYRYFSFDLDRPPLPHLNAYYARLTARPAYRQHVMVPYDELKGTL
jgi:glutathione S-transferase